MSMSRVVTLRPEQLVLSPAVTDLEIVVPAYNEAERLPATLNELVTFLSGQPWRSRVVVVDNGSVDETAAVVREIKSDPVQVNVIGCSQPGKGAAVRRGLLASTATFSGFVDADLSTPLDTLGEAMSLLQCGAAAVVASRHAPGARLVHAQPLGRRVGGAMFRALAKPLVADVHDTQCGFKFFRREVVQAALKRCRTNGFAFDVELLRHVQAAGEQVMEIPVAWTDDSRSTFHPVRDGLAAFSCLVRLRLAEVA